MAAPCNQHRTLSRRKSPIHVQLKICFSQYMMKRPYASVGKTAARCERRLPPLLLWDAATVIMAPTVTKHRLAHFAVERLDRRIENVSIIDHQTLGCRLGSLRIPHTPAASLRRNRGAKTFECPRCDYRCDRDVNGARNIISAGAA